MIADDTYRIGTVMLTYGKTQYTVDYAEEAVGKFTLTWSESPTAEAEQFIKHYLMSRFGSVTIE